MKLTTIDKLLIQYLNMSQRERGIKRKEAFEFVSHYPLVSIRLLKHPIKDSYWNWGALTRNPGILYEEKLLHADLPWDWKFLSAHKRLTLEIIKVFKKGKYDWKYITRHPKIRLNDIIENPQYEWDYNSLSLHPELTSSILRNIMDLPLNITDLSYRFDILSWDIVEQNLNKPWDLMALSHIAPYTFIKENVNLTLDIYTTLKRKDFTEEQKKFLYEVWKPNIETNVSNEYQTLLNENSRNRPDYATILHLNGQYYRSGRTKLWYGGESSKRLEYQIREHLIKHFYVKTTEEKRKSKEKKRNNNNEYHLNILINNHCATLIQNQWRICIANPKYVLCRTRLFREFSEFSL
jgi:hypothetical protein